ncbi:MAG: hypothetical protein HYU71_03920 [Bacteroidetes bacterium]|nr:hypothetical protein [Bacteroidota bacterium]
MKMKFILMLGISLFFRTGVIAQTLDPVSLILSKAIKAIDLKVQRLQNQTLVLQQTQQAAEQRLSRMKLEEIRSWHQQLSGLYAGYFSELKQVKPLISGGNTIRKILLLHEQISVAYARAPKNSSNRPHYDAILNKSREFIQTLQLLLSSQISFKDAERLEMIRSLRDGMEQNYQAMQSIDRQERETIANRKRRQSDIQIVKRLYAIQ